MAERELLEPIHPGEILLEEFLKPMGVSQYRLCSAIRLGWHWYYRHTEVEEMGSIRVGRVLAGIFRGESMDGSKLEVCCLWSVYSIGVRSFDSANLVITP